VAWQAQTAGDVFFPHYHVQTTLPVKFFLLSLVIKLQNLHDQLLLKGL
jgi:hypothetical protein